MRQGVSMRCGKAAPDVLKFPRCPKLNSRRQPAAGTIINMLSKARRSATVAHWQLLAWLQCQWLLKTLILRTACCCLFVVLAGKQL
eukprot:1740574-Pleurochrysis_carterae.AAC.1